MDELTAWLIEGEPWVQYRTRMDLLDQSETHRQVVQARQAMLADPQVRAVVKQAAELSSTVISNHKSAGHPLHRLVFLTDLGLRADDPGLKKMVTSLLKHPADTGAFQVLMNIPPRYGGSGQDQWAWALCDSPLVLYALVKLGLGGDARVQHAAEFLAGLVSENGWHCIVSPELGKFRGPGRKDDPCPYATLATLQALAAMPEWRDGQACRTGAEALLTLWDERRECHPYMFFMGTDFCKFKAPLVWYDIVHVLDVLTQFPWLRRDRRLHAMAEIVQAKADAQGRFTPESVWEAWKDWEFGQKRAPSRWLTLVVRRALKRLQS